MTESHDALLAELDQEVRLYPPRLFAIYGVYNTPQLEGDQPGYIEWGLEFPDEGRAITYSPGSTHTSGSAEDILRSHAALGDARLIWFG